MGNRPERSEEMVAAIDECLATDVLDIRRLQKLRGRILFARSLCYGRFAASALRALNAHCSPGSSPTSRLRSAGLPQELREALATLAKAVRLTPPRMIRVSYAKPVLLFSDGAFEVIDGVARAGIGGLILDAATGQYVFFGGILSDAATAALQSVAENPITYIELLAVACSMVMWTDIVRSRAVLAFVDNEASKHSLVKGSSGSPLMADIISLVSDLEIETQALCYWERVPSHSNPADAPSRGASPPAVRGWPAPQHSSTKDLDTLLAKLADSGDHRPDGARHLLLGMRDGPVSMPVR